MSQSLKSISRSPIGGVRGVPMSAGSSDGDDEATALEVDAISCVRLDSESSPWQAHFEFN